MVRPYSSPYPQEDILHSRVLYRVNAACNLFTGIDVWGILNYDSQLSQALDLRDGRVSGSNLWDSMDNQNAGATVLLFEDVADLLDDDNYAYRLRLYTSDGMGGWNEVSGSGEQRVTAPSFPTNNQISIIEYNQWYPLSIVKTSDTHDKLMISYAFWDGTTHEDDYEVQLLIRDHDEEDFLTTYTPTSLQYYPTVLNLCKSAGRGFVVTTNLERTKALDGEYKFRLIIMGPGFQLIAETSDITVNQPV